MSPGRKKALTITASVLFVTAIGVAWYMLGGTSPAEQASVRVFVCSETGKSFEHKIVEDEDEPVKSPHTGRNTGYSAEACFWTKGDDGKWKAKLTPTWVVLKKRMNPESREKTFCPDCGKEVVGHNPPPSKIYWDAAVKEAKKD
jgi:hypothetical protein